MKLELIKFAIKAVIIVVCVVLTFWFLDILDLAGFGKVHDSTSIWPVGWGR